VGVVVDGAAVWVGVAVWVGDGKDKTAHERKEQTAGAREREGGENQNTRYSAVVVISLSFQLALPP
jgi:hypothetical protein